MITVYGLTDEHGQIRYVGQTQNLKQRFANHRSSQKSFEVAGMAVLSRRDYFEEACAEEVRWIEFFGLSNLANISPGILPLAELDDEPGIQLVMCGNAECSVPFVPRRPWQKFHSDKCHDAFHNQIKKKLIAKARAMSKKLTAA